MDRRLDGGAGEGVCTRSTALRAIITFLPRLNKLKERGGGSFPFFKWRASQSPPVANVHLKLQDGSRLNNTLQTFVFQSILLDSCSVTQTFGKHWLISHKTILIQKKYFGNQLVPPSGPFEVLFFFYLVDEHP